MTQYIADEASKVGSQAHCRSGRALTFDGVNDYVDSGVVIPSIHAASTLSAWVYTSNVSTLECAAAVVSGATSAHEQALLLLNYPSAGQISARINSLSATASGLLVANKWTFLTLTYDGTSVRLYVNGSLAATTAVTPSTSGTARAIIGTNGTTSSLSSQYFSGVIHDVRILNRYLTAAEVVSLYNATKQGSGDVSGTLYAANLVSMWALEDGTTAMDMSGNGYDATVTGPVLYQGSDVPSSIYNELGYTLSGGTYYYAKASDLTKDTLGNTLGNPGPLAKRAHPKGSPCATFDGSNDYASTATAIVGGTAFSVSFRIYRSASGAYQAVIGDWGNDGAKRWIVYSTNTDAIGLYVSDNGTNYLRVDTTTTITVNTWTHVTATWTATGNVVKIYFDGVEQATTVAVSRTIASVANVSTQLRFATSTGSAEYLTGRLSDARIFNRALTATEAAAVSSGSEVTSGLLAHWAVDEKSGLTLLDSSGNGYNATATGMTSGELWANTQDNYHAALIRGIRTGQGKRGYRTFDGSTQFFAGSINTAFNIPSTGRFWAAWAGSFDIGGAAIQAMVGRWRNAGASSWLLYRASSTQVRIAVSYDGTGYLEASVAITNDGLDHLVFAYLDMETRELAVSVDGGAFGTATFTSPNVPASVSADTQVGASGTTNTFKLDGKSIVAAFGLAVSGQSLSAIRTAIYNSGSFLSYDDLTSAQLTDWGVSRWYDCDEWGPSLRDKHSGYDLTGTGYNADYPVPAPVGLIAAPTRHYGTFENSNGGFFKSTTTSSASTCDSGGRMWLCAYMKTKNLTSNRAFFGKYESDTEWLLYTSASDIAFTSVFSDATTGTKFFVATATIGTWTLVFAYEDAQTTPGQVSVGGALNGGTLSGSNFTKSVKAAGSDKLQIGRFYSSNTTPDADIAFCAIGKNPSLTLTQVRDLIYNSGTPLEYSALSAAQKTAIGLTEWFEVGDYQGEETLTGKHASTVMAGSCIPSRTTQGGAAKLPPINTSIDFTGTTLSGGTAASWTSSQYLGYLTGSGSANGRVVTAAITGKVSSGAISVYARLRNFSTSGSYGIFDNDNGSTGSRAFFGTNSGNIAIYDTAYRNLGASLAGVLNDGNWHDVLFVWSGTTATLYIDSVLWGTNSAISDFSTVVSGWARNTVLSTTDNLQKFVGDIARLVVADGVRYPGTILASANILDLRFDAVNCEDEQGRIPSSAWLSGHTPAKLTVPTAYKSGVILPDGMTKVATPEYERYFNLYKQDQ